MYKKIMVPLDGSKLAECVLPHVETVVRGANNPDLVFVQAVEPIAIPYGREVSEVTSIDKLKALEGHHRVDAEKYLNEIGARFENSGAKIRLEVINGKAAEALADYANKNKVDLVILASHGRSGMGRLVWGSVADRLLHSINAPVLIVRAIKHEG